MYETPDSFATFDRKQWTKEQLGERVGHSGIFKSKETQAITMEKFNELKGEVDATLC